MICRPVNVFISLTSRTKLANELTSSRKEGTFLDFIYMYIYIHTIILVIPVPEEGSEPKCIWPVVDAGWSATPPLHFDTPFRNTLCCAQAAASRFCCRLFV